ncbi:MAG: RluA family pseudouridine synthase [Candidatus Halichondribacter symbioticus]
MSLETPTDTPTDPPIKIGVQMIEVKPDDAEQRLDRWLRRVFPQLTQGQIEKMCRKGQLRADGERVKSATRLIEGQMIRVPPIPTKDAAFDYDPHAPRARPLKQSDIDEIRACVLYKDDDILVINKPAGLPVQGGSKQTRHLDGLSSALMFESDIKPRLVHRLDKDTSGVMVMARSRMAAARLARAFAGREVRKVYWAVVAGCPNPRAGRIRYALIKSIGKDTDNEKMRCVLPDVAKHDKDAQPAITDYMMVETAGKRLSWLAMMPITGRRHQLRAHIAEVGSPILGDRKYGAVVKSGDVGLARPGERAAPSIAGVDEKLHLHARVLMLRHPMTQKKLEFVAPLPEHMARTWALLDWPDDTDVSDPFDEG